MAGNSQARQQLEDPEELLGSEHVADRGPLMDERRRREIDQVREIVDEEADIRAGIESATQSMAECAPQVESVTREEFARLELSSLEYKSTPSGIFSPDTAPPFMRLVGNLVRERKDGTVWARLSPDTGEGRGFRRLDEHTASMAQEYSPGELAAAGIECHVSLHVDTGDVPGHGPAGYPASGSVGLWAKPGVLGISLKGEGFYHLIASRHWDEAKAAKFPEFLQWAKPAPREWLSNIASEAELKTLLMALPDEKIGVLTSGRRDLAQPRPGRTGAPLLSRVRPRGAPDAAPR